MNQRQVLTPPSSVYHPMMQQFLELQAIAMPCCQCRGFYGFPLTFCACQCHIIYPGTRIAHWWQHQLEYQYYRLPSSGPSRNQNRIGSREAEALHQNQYLHESSGTVLEDHSTGVDPGYARIGANDKTGGGEKKPYDRGLRRHEHPSKFKVPVTVLGEGTMAGVAPSPSTEYGDFATLGIRSDEVNPSTFAVPNIDPGSVPSFTSPAYRDRTNWSIRSDEVDLLMFEVPIAGGAMAPTPVAPTSMSVSAVPISTAYTGNRDSDAGASGQEQPIEEEDFDTISLGSDTD